MFFTSFVTVRCWWPEFNSKLWQLILESDNVIHILSWIFLSGTGQYLFQGAKCLTLPLLFCCLYLFPFYRGQYGQTGNMSQNLTNMFYHWRAEAIVRSVSILNQKLRFYSPRSSLRKEAEILRWIYWFWNVGA